MALPTESPSLRLATWRHVMIMIDMGAHRPSEYSEAERIFSDHAEKCGGKGTVLTIIPANAKQPEPESQRAISAAIDRIAPRMDGFVWVVEGTGFGNALVRATLMTIALAKRKPYASRVVSNVSEGLGWLVNRRPVTAGLSIDQGVAVAEALRKPELRSSAIQPRRRQPLARSL